ncbi:class I SAM-dependent methyltransferase [Streptomyces sp. NBC_01207]|uniref:class I SAM-dependent methyltransferase n=1 Tax=Streptomyces sp. NBC_01207 TaxID=2903772 RepID=UPI002E1013C6|nr:class I SAM-dependent methyltransferase [Streptomyces sp. NBC_01207]
MTSNPVVRPEIIEFYTRSNEAARLQTTATGSLEFTRTRELLRRHLPPAPARVLDVGGGPGAHARWLADDGYTVHVVDPVPKHVTQAATIGGVTAELGDARRLAAAAGTYDVVLLLGPLYHLHDQHDRISALTEAARVARPGGVIAAAAISRYSPLLDYIATTGITEPRIQDGVRDTLAQGRYAGQRGFTVAYFQTSSELRAEITDAGLTDPTIYGVEGPGWVAVKAIEKYTGANLMDTDMYEAALAAARMAEPHAALTDASAHVLAITGPGPV